MAVEKEPGEKIVCKRLSQSEKEFENAKFLCSI